MFGTVPVLFESLRTSPALIESLATVIESNMIFKLIMTRKSSWTKSALVVVVRSHAFNVISNDVNSGRSEATVDALVLATLPEIFMLE